MTNDVYNDRKAMDALLDHVDELHSLPQVAVSVLNLTRDLDYDVREVVSCLENDPALASKILRIVNSSNYSLRRPIASLQQAVALLGHRALRLVAMTFSLVDGLARGVTGEFCQDYWKRSISMASIASRLARQSGRLDHNEAYAAGLLADLGVLILAQVKGNEYIKLAGSTPHGSELIETEQQAFGYSHAALGGQLLSRWGFSDSLITAVGHHHENIDSDNPLYETARASSLLSDVLWNAESTQLPAARLFLEERFEYDVDSLIDLAVEVKKDITFSAELFGIKIAEEIDLEAIRQRAHEQYETAVSQIRAELIDEAAELLGGGFDPSSEDKSCHLGTNVIKLYRDCDPMRTGIRVEFDDITAGSLTIRLLLPLGTYEQVKVQIENEVQGFSCELRGTVRSSEVIDGRGCRAEIELLRRLSSFDLSALGNAGLQDKPVNGPVWM